MFTDDYKLVAHRGLHNIKEGIPENSTAAFQKAVERGHGIELDVHMTEDGEMVVFHDWDTKRLTGSSNIIERSHYSRLRKLRLCGTEYSIPIIQDVLELVDGKVPLVIEIKKRRKDHYILEKRLMSLLRYYKGPFILESFNPMTVRWLKNHVPKYIRGQLSSHKDSGMLQKAAMGDFTLNFLTKPNFIAYDIDGLTKAMADSFREKNMAVIGWTIKTQQQYEKAQKLCDGIIYEGLEL